MEKNVLRKPRSRGAGNNGNDNVSVPRLTRHLVFKRRTKYRHNDVNMRCKYNAGAHKQTLVLFAK